MKTIQAQCRPFSTRVDGGILASPEKTEQQIYQWGQGLPQIMQEFIDVEVTWPALVSFHFKAFHSSHFRPSTATH